MLLDSLLNPLRLREDLIEGGLDTDMAEGFLALLEAAASIFMFRERFSPTPEDADALFLALAKQSPEMAASFRANFEVARENTDVKRQRQEEILKTLPPVETANNVVSMPPKLSLKLLKECMTKLGADVESMAFHDLSEEGIHTIMIGVGIASLVISTGVTPKDGPIYQVLIPIQEASQHFQTLDEAVMKVLDLLRHTRAALQAAG